MGNDAFIFCRDCKKREFIGRAYRYKPELINKKLSPEIIDQLIILTEKINASLEKIILSDTRVNGVNPFEDMLDFAEEHKGHELWLIDDFSDFNWQDDSDAEL